MSRAVMADLAVAGALTKSGSAVVTRADVNASPAITPTSGSVALDVAALDLVGAATHALAGHVTYTTSNRAAGRSFSIRVSAVSLRTLTFPAWVFVGAAAPASIAAGKVGILTVTFFGTADTDAIAAWAVQP